MKSKSYICISLIAMFILSSIAVMGVGAWAPPTDNTYYWIEDHIVSTTDNLTSTYFNVTVNIYNVTDLGAWEYKFTFNNTLLEAVWCYQSTWANTSCEYWGPVDPVSLVWTPTSGINNSIGGGLGQVHTGASVKSGQELTGNVTLMTIKFHIIYAPEQLESVDNVVSCSFHFTTHIMGNHLGDPIAHLTDDGYYEYTRVGYTPGAPTCDFTWSPNKPAVGETTSFTDLSTGGGYPIASWAWDLDGDGAYDDSAAQNPTWVYGAPGTVMVSLNVTNSLGYSDNKTKPLTVIVPGGPKIDVYTQNYRQYPEGTITPHDGKGVGADCDSFAPGENVSLWALVTYNEEPVQNILVGFEVRAANGTCVTYRTDPTDEIGIAQVWFRIPIPCNPAEQEDYTFGHWFVIAKCKLQDAIINDTMSFKVGFIVQITSLTVTPPAQYKCEYLTFNMTVKNIAWVNRSVTLIVVVYDDCDVPIGQVVYPFTIPAATAVLCSSYNKTNIILELHIPKWAYVGTHGKVYATAFTDLPINCGIPYCPEVFQPVEILKTP